MEVCGKGVGLWCENVRCPVLHGGVTQVWGWGVKT